MAEQLATVTFNGKPIDTLAKALELMQRYMGYTAKSAVTAMAINVLRGLRSRTKVADAKGSHMESLSRAYYPGFLTLPGGKRQRTVRAGHGGHHINNWKATRQAHGVGSEQWLEVGIYHVKFPQRKDLKAYFGAAVSKEDIREQVVRRHPVTIYKGMARKALGIAMAKVSGTVPGGDFVGARASVVASRLVEVRRSGNAITVEDNLGYAQKAVKGGAAAIEKAQTAAVKKVIGWFHHQYHRLWEAACAGRTTPESQLDELLRL